MNSADGRILRQSRFIKRLNEVIYARHPGVLTIAGGIHVVADGFASDLFGRAGIQLEMEHGLDERHAKLFCRGSRSTGNTITIG